MPNIRIPGSRLIFQAIKTLRRNKLRNVSGLILKLRIIVAVQDLKISFYKQTLVPPTFGYCPLTSFALVTALHKFHNAQDCSAIGPKETFLQTKKFNFAFKLFLPLPVVNSWLRLKPTYFHNFVRTS